MWRRASRSREAGAALALAALLAWSGDARAQACCAGSGALTPGLLALHEDALVGLQLHAADVFGSFDAAGHYRSSPAGTTEIDAEEDLFGALRFLRQGQVAALVPLVETRRQTRSVGSELGGGIGDVNLAARWDFTTAGQYRLFPGIGLLAGVTFPTGTPPEKTTRPLATDTTGIGAFQGNVGLAFEQTFGSWLVNVTGLAAKRLKRTANGVSTTLGTQYTALGALAYTFPDETAAALLASYTFEGDATVDGQDAPNSGRKFLRVSVAGAHPLDDHWRLQGSLFFDPPIVGLAQNMPMTTGFTLAVLRTWM